MREILEKNMLYFELYKKDKFQTNNFPVRSHKFVFFGSSKYNAIFKKLPTSIQDKYVFTE
jgi:hypothetical protein